MIQKCTECKQTVSSDADACPHCGYRMRGREHMIKCSGCKNEIFPITNPHDTISKYCPICQKPATNLGCRYVFLGIVLTVFVVILIVVISGFRFLFQ